MNVRSLIISLILISSTPCLAETAVQALMKQKLESAHGLLEGLMLADYAKIESHAKKLQDIGRATTWYRNDSEDFLMFAKSFQNSAAFLAAQAHDKNIEGVSMGYIRLTLDCIRCHNAIRPAPVK